MIIGYRHSKKEALEEKYSVVIKIPKPPDGDKLIGVIIQSDTVDSRQGCKREIERMLSGIHREPPQKEDDDDDIDESSRLGLIINCTLI